MAKTATKSETKRSPLKKRPPAKELPTRLPPGFAVGDVVWAFIPCPVCGPDEDCPHFEDELGVIFGATAKHLVLTVLRSSSDGQLAFVERAVGWSRRNQLTRLEGSGSEGLLRNWFTLDCNDTHTERLDGYGGLPYNAKRLHAASGWSLLHLYLNDLEPRNAFDLLEFSARVLGDGGYREHADMIAWATALNSRNVATQSTEERVQMTAGPSRELVNVLRVRAAIVDCLTQEQLLEHTHDALRRLNLDRPTHRAAAIVLIGMAWSALRSRPAIVLEGTHVTLGLQLLAKALEIDARLNRPPLFWMAIEPLPGIDPEAHYGTVRRSLMAHARSIQGGWARVHAYVVQTHLYPDWLARAGLSRVMVDRLWLEAWMKNGADRIFDADYNLVPADDRQTARRWTIARLHLLNSWMLDELLKKDSCFWRSLDEEQRQQVAEGVVQMALDPAVAERLRALTELPAELRAVLPAPAE